MLASSEPANGNFPPVPLPGPHAVDGLSLTVGGHLAWTISPSPWWGTQEENRSGKPPKFGGTREFVSAERSYDAGFGRRYRFGTV